MQASLVNIMLAAGEAALAEEYCNNIFKLDFASFEVDIVTLEAEKQKRRDVYLQLHVDTASVHFVDTVPALEVMSAALGANSTGPAGTSLDGVAASSHAASGWHLPCALGIDVEWVPGGDNSSCSSSPASLLQLATDDAVFVVDLLALGAHSPQALSGALQPVLLNESTYKLGIGLAGDLRKLATSYPSVEAFQAANACIDLATLWRARHGASLQLPTASHAWHLASILALPYPDLLSHVHSPVRCPDLHQPNFWLCRHVLNTHPQAERRDRPEQVDRGASGQAS